jgi:4-amino-4-deoxy-L-arabinose transferase-like glycosyltransferase
MRTRVALAAIWLCFLLRAVFYSTMLPLWEGYDEWAHFSVARIMAVRGVLIVPRGSPVPRDVAASFGLAPVPYDMREYPPPILTQDSFWKLAPEERARREAAFRAMPDEWKREDSTGPFMAYEAHHPPLFYWLAALALKLAGGWSLAAQVMLLRWMASLVASLDIPLVFLAARAVFRDNRLALGCAAVLALMPEFVIYVARVSNDCVAAPLFTLLIYACVKLIRDGLSYRVAGLAGAALGFGMLSKAYFLTALPVVAAVYVYAWVKAARSGQGGAAQTPRAGPLLCGILTPAVLGGWWYARNLVLQGTVSGMLEASATRRIPVSEALAAAWRINWLKVTDGVLLSHLYFGGWSSLTARAWMYHVFYAVIAAAAVGLLLRVRGAAMACLAGFYLSFWAGQYLQAEMLALSAGVAASMGWFTYAVAAAEIPLAIAGLRAILPPRARAWVAPAGAAMFGLLDFYTVHALALPYYTGMIAHKANGAVAGLHWADLGGFALVLKRLAVFKGQLVTPALIAVLWLAYLAGTGAAAILAFRTSLHKRVAD